MPPLTVHICASGNNGLSDSLAVVLGSAESGEIFKCREPVVSFVFSLKNSDLTFSINVISVTYSMLIDLCFTFVNSSQIVHA